MQAVPVDRRRSASTSAINTGGVEADLFGINLGLPDWLDKTLEGAGRGLGGAIFS